VKKSVSRVKLNRDDQLCRRAHRAEVRADVYGVRNKDKRQEAVQYFTVVISLTTAAMPLARHRADARACFLDRHHEREQVERGPQLPVAELRRFGCTWRCPTDRHPPRR